MRVVARAARLGQAILQGRSKQRSPQPSLEIGAKSTWKHVARGGHLRATPPDLRSR
jgi:hypothetical protein